MSSSSGLRQVPLPPHGYHGKPEPHRRRGYALISRNDTVVGGPYSTTANANETRRLFHPGATVELVEVTH